MYDSTPLASSINSVIQDNIYEYFMLPNLTSIMTLAHLPLLIEQSFERRTSKQYFELGGRKDRLISSTRLFLMLALHQRSGISL